MREIVFVSRRAGGQPELCWERLSEAVKIDKDGKGDLSRKGRRRRADARMHTCSHTHVHIDCASVLTERPPRNENGQLTVFE